MPAQVVEATLRRLRREAYNQSHRKQTRCAKRLFEAFLRNLFVSEKIRSSGFSLRVFPPQRGALPQSPRYAK
jgi:hypothetical protein